MTETQRTTVSAWTAKHSHWWMGLMLITLHGALAWGIETWWARGLMLAHFGFFLMWQPVWRADREISAISALLIIAVGLVLGFIASWWLTALWLGVLAGLIGGKAFGAESTRQRTASLIALLYLLGMLLGWVVPQLFPDYHDTPAVVALMRYGWLTFPVVLLFIPQERAASATHVVDFIYSVMLFLLVMVLVLGSFALKLVTKGDYLFAVAQTLLGLAAMLFILAWLWKPRAGFSGFGQLLSRYLLSVGLPFEQWIQSLAHLAEAEREPEAFLQKAMVEIHGLPWVAGGVWRTLDEAGEFGYTTPHCIEIDVHRLQLALYTRGRVSPSLMVHVRLLTELLEFFYEAKLREQLQRQNAYVQAIHETGARLTHDVKNLLQSLTALCSAAETTEADQAEALQMLIRRQLPLITRRLDQTLKKLKAPHMVGREEILAAEWWQNLRVRYEPHGVAFELEGVLDGCQIPAELFDSVADNLLQNAIKKRGAEVGVLIRARFTPQQGGALKIEDSGSVMPEATALKLFRAPVASHTGLGIGLYQAARQAEQLGYQLRVAQNEAGKVGFELQIATTP
jgi:signal transduction histidine kinase